jgi:hypothetical protein
MSPPVVKASRRLLITAVREVVNESALLATKKDALRRTESAKRLQSVVSSDPGNLPFSVCIKSDGDPGDWD